MSGRFTAKTSRLSDTTSGLSNFDAISVVRDHGFTAVWFSGNALVSINVVALCRARLVQGWVTVCVGIPSWYLTKATQAYSAWPFLRG